MFLVCYKSVFVCEEFFGYLRNELNMGVYIKGIFWNGAWYRKSFRFETVSLEILYWVCILRIRRINLCKVRGRVRAGGGNLLGDEISLVRLIVYLYYYTQGSRTFELILVIWAPPRVADQSLATSGETLLVL